MVNFKIFVNHKIQKCRTTALISVTSAACRLGDGCFFFFCRPRQIVFLMQCQEGKDGISNAQN